VWIEKNEKISKMSKKTPGKERKRVKPGHDDDEREGGRSKKAREFEWRHRERREQTRGERLEIYLLRKIRIREVFLKRENGSSE
jgi:hypothetical protein